MKRPLDPPGWTPDLVPELERKVKERLRARRKRQRDKYAEKARARDALKPKKPLRVPRQEKPKAEPRVRPRKGRAIGRHAWMRMLIVAYCAQGPFRVSDISRALGSDPYTVGQLVKGLQDSGVLPSNLGRTPIASRAQPKR